MSKMFTKDGKRVKVYNPISGCDLHRCIYCWARPLAEGKLAKTKKYREFKFAPAFHPHELRRALGRNNVYFVCDMGDMWAADIPFEWIDRVMEKITAKTTHPSNEFWFLTKNPERYVQYFTQHDYSYLKNIVLGATIEGTWDYPEISKAPPMEQRYLAMTNPFLEPYRKFLSIEPVMKFDVKTFVEWISKIKPEFVYIGYDNYHKVGEEREPTPEEFAELVKRLQSKTEVRLKSTRLKNGRDN